MNEDTADSKTLQNRFQFMRDRSRRIFKMTSLLIHPRRHGLKADGSKYRQVIGNSGRAVELARP